MRQRPVVNTVRRPLRLISVYPLKLLGPLVRFHREHVRHERRLAVRENQDMWVDLGCLRPTDATASAPRRARWDQRTINQTKGVQATQYPEKHEQEWQPC
jgi:hypothetical protein